MSLKVVEHRTHYVIHIKWDNFTKRDIEVIKKIPGKGYNPVHQVWTAPLTSKTQVEDLKKSCRAVIMKVEEQKPEMTGTIAPLPEPTIEPPVKNITMRHYQRQGSERMVHFESCMNGDDPGLGKAQSLTSRISTPFGWKLMGAIKIGDKVNGADGKIYEVSGVFPQGIRKVYKVLFNDGFSCECDIEHLWTVRDQNRRRRGEGWAVKSLSELIKWGIEHTPHENRLKSGRQPALKWEIPTAEPAYKKEKDYIIHPYILGALIGDGYICGTTVTISIPDFQFEIHDKISQLLPTDLKLYANRYPTCPQYNITQNTTTKKNPYKAEIKRLKLNVKGPIKFIPRFYLEGSVDQRKQLLYGLMDTDGSCKKNRTTFHTVSTLLAYDIAELVQSLGGVAIVRKYDRTKHGKGFEYQVNIRTSFCPFTLQAKCDHWSENKRIFASRYIKSVEYVREDFVQCISVTSPDNLYLTDNYIVTHNTIQTICAILMLKKYPAVICCPATLKLNWKSEIEKFSNLKAMILEDSNKQSWMRYFEAGRADVFITNYESLKKYFVEKMPESGRFMAKQIILRSEWSKVRVFVIDESHRAKDPKTQQTRLLLRLGFQKEHVFLLTGTPVVNKPIDLYPQLAIMGKLHHFGDKKGFIERYCDGGTGANNLKELKFLMNKYCYFKRNKRDVLTEIPPKQRQTLVCEINNRKEYDLAENEFTRWLRNAGSSEKGIEKSLQAEFLVKMGVLRKISALGKIPTVIEYAEDIMSSGEKVVLFAHHREIFEKLYAHFPEALFVTGGISQEKRTANVNAFQNDPKRKLIICGNKPGGVGITLTASSNIGIIEYPWHWAECLQIEDRLDRIGQLNSVMATYFFGKDTIDQRLFDIIQEKKDIGNTISGSEDNIPVSTINKIMNLFS